MLQRKDIVNVQITGLTHLREASQDGSLVRGTDFAEISYPDTVTIDRDDIWDSRLGMNLHVSDVPSHLWYRVVAHNGFPLDRREVYVRSGMFRELDVIQVTEPMRKLTAEAVDRASKKGSLNAQVLYQSLGDVWEAYLWPLMKAKRGGSTVYWNLRFEGAELDFVFIDAMSVRIVSAKINRKQFSPQTDKQHWAEIKKNWDVAKAAKNVEYDGPDIAAKDLPAADPIVICESLETQGLSKPEFEKLIGVVK